MKKKRILWLSSLLLICMTLITVAVLAASCTRQPSAPDDDIIIDPNSDYEYVKAKGELIIGYMVNEPLIFFDGAGNLTGLDAELAHIICSKLLVEPNFVEIDWDTKEADLDAKKIDCIWYALAIAYRNEGTMSITDPYAQNAQVIVMKTGADYTGTPSLTDKTICADSGSMGVDAIVQDANLQQSNYILLYGQTDCLNAVAVGAVEAAVLDLVFVKTMTGPGTDYADIMIVDRLAVEDYSIGFRMDSDLCDRANEILRELAADGTLKSLADKYGLDPCQQ